MTSTWIHGAAVPSDRSDLPPTMRSMACDPIALRPAGYWPASPRCRLASAFSSSSTQVEPVRKSSLDSEATQESNPHVKLVSYNQGGDAELEGRRRLDQFRPDHAAGAARQDRLARFLDVLLHQLPSHPAGPGQARREIQERAGGHRRPFRPSSTPSATPRTSAAKSREYRIKHPVVNDAKMTIWKHFGVQELADPGADRRQWRVPGRSSAARGITTSSTARSASSSRPHKAEGDLNLTPLKFTPEMERPSNGPLLVPGQGPRRRGRQAAVHRRHRP